MKQFESKYIVQVSHPEYFGNEEYTFLKKIGNAACHLTFTHNIYSAKTFDNEKVAQKTADRVKEYVETAYKNGWTSYGYNFVPGNDIGCGHFESVMKTIDVKVIEVKLTIV